MSVLFLLSLLTVLALGALNATRRHAQLAQTSFQLVQQRELADSALRLTILELTAPLRTTSAASLGRRSVELFGQNVTVDVQLESGRIDLNYANEMLLTAAFAANNVSDHEARALAARIVDWRDADDRPTAHGAERSDYRRLNRIGPRNAPFENVSELIMVLGAEQLGENILDMFTVFSHQAEVRESAALPAVLNALRWANKQQLGGRSWLTDSASGAGSEAQRSLAGEVLRLQACTTSRPPQTCRSAVVRLTGNRFNPALVFAWQ